MKACFKNSSACLEKLSWFPPLLARVSVGWVFLESGWGKLHRIPKVVEFFAELGIPMPQIQAPFVAGVEFLGGLLVIVGLLTRPASFLLICTMVVAIITAKKEDISSVSDLFNLSEYLFIVILLWLVFSGPGKMALDQVLKNKCSSKSAD